jgi:hypothetical protein
MKRLGRENFAERPLALAAVPTLWSGYETDDI